MKILLFVPGVPVPKGSAKSFYSPKSKRIVTMQDNRDRQKPWASMISYFAQEAGCEVSQGPMSLRLSFTMPRPKSHYGTGKNASVLKPAAPINHTSTPDLDKLIRCVKDALTGVAWRDDSQVCFVVARKAYGDLPGVSMAIEEEV
jgi:Holliday junction resolvase RusA-like endonuclease